MSAISKLLLRSGAATPNIMQRSATATAKRSFAAAASGDSDSLKTVFYDLHVELGGNIVDFAGYKLPVFYKGDTGGVKKEHLHCRSEGKSSLFDVSHMGQIRWHGADRVKFLEKLLVSDIGGLDDGTGCLSLITNENGGIKDDTVIVNAGDHIHMVVNGACKVGDMKHFQEHLDANTDLDVTMEYLGDDKPLLALQGPGAAEAISKLLPSGFDLKNMAFMTGTDTTLDGIEGCRITRCGYTGEDGFEISMPVEHANSIASKLLEDSSVLPTGLGARDSLRLEAGLCLYGNDLDESTTPIEGVLGWTIGPPKSRRRIEGGFLGADKILTPEGKFQKVSRKRVGIKGMKAPAREHTEIYDAEGTEKIGEITSGTFSPTLNCPIAMGYIETAKSPIKADTDVTVKIRNKMHSAKITKMPFIEPNYYRIPE